MDAAAVHLTVKFTPREVAALRAALVHVQHEPDGLSEVARLELDANVSLTDAEIDSVVSVLGHAAEVWVITANEAAVHVDDQRQQLLREAFELLNDADSALDVRDWTREARKVLRPEAVARTA